MPSKKKTKTTKVTGSNHTANRFDMIVMYDVKNGNPNGDPDADNLPRQDDESEHGLVTDVCLKRKIRDMVKLLTQEPGHAIFISTDGDPTNERVLNPKIEASYKAKKLSPNKAESVSIARQYMCDNYFDIRTFGAVLSTGKAGYNAGKVTGPIQCSFGESVDPITIVDHCISRKCVTKTDAFENQIKKGGDITGTLGRKATVPYALYRQSIWFNPHLAEKTGFNDADLVLFFKALIMCFQNDRSAARGHLSFRGLWAFEHSSPLGNCHDYELFDSIVTKTKDSSTIPRSFDDYEITVNHDNIPTDVTLHVLKHVSQVDEIFG